MYFDGNRWRKVDNYYWRSSRPLPRMGKPKPMTVEEQKEFDAWLALQPAHYDEHSIEHAVSEYFILLRQYERAAKKYAEDYVPERFCKRCGASSNSHYVSKDTGMCIRCILG